MLHAILQLFVFFSQLDQLLIVCLCLRSLNDHILYMSEPFRDLVDNYLVLLTSLFLLLFLIVSRFFLLCGSFLLLLAVLLSCSFSVLSRLKFLQSFRVLVALDNQSDWTVIDHLNVHVLAESSWEDVSTLGRLDFELCLHLLILSLEISKELVVEHFRLLSRHCAVKVWFRSLHGVIECELRDE